MLTCGLMDNAHTSTFAVIARCQVLIGGLMDSARMLSFAVITKVLFTGKCSNG